MATTFARIALRRPGRLALFAHITRAAQRLFAPKPPRLNPHLSRDIGMSNAEIARAHHQWPSQSTLHPML